MKPVASSFVVDLRNEERLAAVVPGVLNRDVSRSRNTEYDIEHRVEPRRKDVRTESRDGILRRIESCGVRSDDDVGAGREIGRVGRSQHAGTHELLHRHACGEMMAIAALVV